MVLSAVRWYRRYGISYRDLEQDRRARHSAPEIEKRMGWQWRRPRSGSWRVDETWIKVRGKWARLYSADDLYRAVDKFGDTIGFHPSPTRITKAARR